ALRERQGLHLARALRGHPRVGGGAHRLARDPARSGRPDGSAELAAIERREPELDGQKILRRSRAASKLETLTRVLLTKVSYGCRATAEPRASRRAAAGTPDPALPRPLRVLQGRLARHHIGACQQSLVQPGLALAAGALPAALAFHRCDAFPRHRPG